MTEHDAVYRAILMSPEDNTPRRIFADFLEDNGEPELSEFVRVQSELANGHHCVNCGGKGYMGYGSFTATCKWCRPESLRLRSRERELFTAHGREWFGPNATLTPPNERESRAPDWWCVIPARGFPAHWYGSWSAWVGGDCERCESDPVGSAHRNACSGRIPGACETVAWRPTWEMECGNCGGFGEFRRRHDNGDGPEGPCPECGGKWLSGPFLDPDDYWDSGSGRVPRPCPPGAVPLETVNLSNEPPMADLIQIAREVGIDIESVPRERGRELICEAKWKGLTFHLPAN